MLASASSPLSPLPLTPINAEGIDCVTHPYANQRAPPWEPKRAEDFWFRRRDVSRGGHRIRGICRAGRQRGCLRTGDYQTSRGQRIRWTVWCFDPEWRPSLMSNWEYKLTPSEEFVRAAMMGER